MHLCNKTRANWMPRFQNGIQWAESSGCLLASEQPYETSLSWHPNWILQARPTKEFKFHFLLQNPKDA